MSHNKRPRETSRRRHKDFETKYYAPPYLNNGDSIFESAIHIVIGLMMHVLDI
jgi:hypothetical protein